MAFTLSGDAATTRTNLGLGDAATKTTGTAAGNVPVLDSSGKIADAQIAALSVSKLTGVGTSGQVLTSTGTTTAPTMQDAAGGAIIGVYKRGNDSVASWNTTYVAAVNSHTITPKSSTSGFHISAQVNSATATDGPGIWLQVQVNSGSWVDLSRAPSRGSRQRTGGGFGYWRGDNDNVTTHTAEGFYQATTTDTVQFRCALGWDTGYSYTFVMNRSLADQDSTCCGFSGLTWINVLEVDTSSNANNGINAEVV